MMLFILKFFHVKLYNSPMKMLPIAFDYWSPLNLSKLTPALFYIELTHFGCRPPLYAFDSLNFI